MPTTIGSPRELWEEAPRLDLAKSVGREAERTSGRRETSPEGLMCPELQGILNHSEFAGWYPHYKSCVEYFVEHGQHNQIVQSVAAFINICLPCQRSQNVPAQDQPTIPFVSLRPYVRRLIITALDSSFVMRAFFGDHWVAGVCCIHKQERANYLFMAKSSGWGATKAAYDTLPNEQAPFIKPLYEPSEDEIRAAEAQWSEWLATEDWMVGSRSPW
ncbi:hypothetical protein N7451_012754 [Penicillium sp. IBT 35674x]|nr:hypothetical protein N7451_012754 [Penicillium sp. IBT 35674x]